MMSIKRTFALGAALTLGMSVLMGMVGTPTVWAQAATSQRGTVKAVAGNSLTVTTDTGAAVPVTVPEGARLVQVAPGSTSLAGAQAITMSDINVGDKVLVTGKTDGSNFNATRVIVMKSTDIAKRNAQEQADWQRRGMGGIVNAVDTATGTITFTAGTKKIEARTSGTTGFRRYAEDSVKFSDAKPGTLPQLRPGDQIEVLGTKSADGSSVQAEQVVSGAFLNLSGTLASVNAEAHTITLKDLKTKKNITVTVTANSDLRKLPPEIAARFAARQRGAAGGEHPAGAQGSGRGGAGMDLSRMLARLPNTTLADLHSGDAVMIVASQANPGSDAATAVTMLSGVEPILTAPGGSGEMTLSPWSVGGGAPDAGGGTN